MKPSQSHIQKSLQSAIQIDATAETIWDHITQVDLEEFSDPFLFKLLNIPKPTRAELIIEGKTRKRIAYFASGKRFFQQILIWKPFEAYSFSFNPEKGFRVGYIFDLSQGVFQLQKGAYRLLPAHAGMNLVLSTTYSLDKRLSLWLDLPVRLVLKHFQAYLLQSIKRNAEQESSI